MKIKALILLQITLTMLCLPVSLYAQSDETLIRDATLPLPLPMRAGATVIKRGADGEAEVIRQGNNGLICQADSPDRGYSVGCSHESWSPVLARLNELTASRMPQIDAQTRINQELQDGTLQAPVIGALANVISGPNANNAALLTTVFLGEATGESTGLPTTPSNGAWLMCSGTPQARLMVGLPPYNTRNMSLEALCGRPPR